jgi:hypothetical protein
MNDLSGAILRGADAIDARSDFDPAHRASFLNASEAMSCIRKQWYDKHADPAEKDGPEDWGYARRGKHAERYIVECLQAANAPMLFVGEDQVQIADDERRISCTPDGLVHASFFDDGSEGWIACEFKSIDPRTNRSNLPRDPHVRQVQIAAAMFNEFAAEFPELKGEPVVGCRLLYIDASNFNAFVERKVPLKPSILDQLKSRANRILDGTSAARLPREGQQTPFQAECKQRCKWTRKCGVEGAGTSTGQGREGAGDMARQVEVLVEEKALVAQHKAAQDQAAEQIKAILKRDGLTHAQVGEHVVRLSTRAGSVSYATVVKEHLPDLDLEPYRGQPTEVLTVK